MNEWLRDLSLVAGARRYPHNLLLYEGVVPHGRVRLEGVVADPNLQQVQVEHFAGPHLVRIKVVPVRRGKFFCHLDLFRGRNEISVGCFDASGRVQARRVTYRTRLREWSEVFLVALSMALILRTFLLQAFEIPSDSMRETLRRHDRILVDKLVYKLDEPERGDLVIFDTPEEPGVFFVKRVVGLPGEVVEIRGNEVLVDGHPLVEPYRVAPPRDPALPPPEAVPWQVPEDAFFVLGDNRMISKDSRNFGFLRRERLVGRAFFRYWPPGRVGSLR